MRDIPLKYKFWLVNIITFMGMLVLTLYAMKRTQSALALAGQPQDFSALFWSEAAGYASVVFVLMLCVMGGSQALIWFVQRNITTLRDAMQAVQHQRDLRIRVNTSSADEVGDMGCAFNAMQDVLQSVVVQVDTASTDVAESVGTLNDAVTRTYEGLKTQNSSVAHIELQMKTMLDSSRDVLRDANEAQQYSSDACELTHDGRDVVVSLAEAFQTLASDVQQSEGLMRQLSADSDRIERVLNVIREIAEQTNLLALNAAIEAARAGESGRGFAVVADEVRSLAVRASESTDEIRTIVEALQRTTHESVILMNDSVERASASHTLTGRASEALQSINSAVEQIRHHSAKISHSMERQVASADQVYHSVDDIHNITQNTVDIANLLSGSGEELSSLAGCLRDTVGQFRV